MYRGGQAGCAAAGTLRKRARKRRGTTHPTYTKNTPFSLYENPTYTKKNGTNRQTTQYDRCPRKKHLSCESWSRNPAAETALQPLIWCSTRESSSPEEFFSQTPV